MSFLLSNHPKLELKLNNLLEEILLLIHLPECKKYLEEEKLTSNFKNIFSPNNFIRQIMSYCIVENIKVNELPMEKEMVEIARIFTSKLKSELEKEPSLYNIFSSFNIKNNFANEDSFCFFNEENYPRIDNIDLEHSINKTLYFVNKVKNNHLKRYMLLNVLNDINMFSYYNYSKKNDPILRDSVEKIQDALLYTTQQEYQSSKVKDLDIFLKKITQLQLHLILMKYTQIKNNYNEVVANIRKFIKVKDELLSEFSTNQNLCEKLNFNRSIFFFPIIFSYYNIIFENNKTLRVLIPNEIFHLSIEYSKYKGKFKEEDEDLFLKLKYINKLSKEVESPLKETKNDLFSIEEYSNKNILESLIFVKANKDSDLLLLKNINNKDINFYEISTEENCINELKNGEYKWIIYSKDINSNSKKLFKLIYQIDDILLKDNLKERIESSLAIKISDVLNSYVSPLYQSDSNEEFDKKRSGLVKNIDFIIDATIREVILNKELEQLDIDNSKKKITKKKI